MSHRATCCIVVCIVRTLVLSHEANFVRTRTNECLEGIYLYCRERVSAIIGIGHFWEMWAINFTFVAVFGFGRKGNANHSPLNSRTNDCSFARRNTRFNYGTYTLIVLYQVEDCELSNFQYIHFLPRFQNITFLTQIN